MEIRFIFLKLKQNIKVQIFLGKVPIWIWNFCIFVSIALVLFFIINKQINWTDIPVWIQHDYTLTFSNAYISGWILYLIVHYIPERKQKEIVKRNLKKQYTWLKGKIIHEFLLSIYGHSDPELEVELLNVKKFNSFMDYKVNQSEVRSKKQEDEKLSNDEWLSSYSNRMNALINKINFDSFKEIQKDISIFNKHFLYFMQKIKIENKYVYDCCLNISNIMHEMELLELDNHYGNEGIFMDRLIKLFSGWNFLQGRLDYDVIEKLIDNV